MGKSLISKFYFSHAAVLPNALFLSKINYSLAEVTISICRLDSIDPLFCFVFQTYAAM